MIKFLLIIIKNINIIDDNGEIEWYKILIIFVEFSITFKSLIKV